MTKIVRRSVDFPGDVWETIEQESRDVGVPVSALVTDAVREWVTLRRGLRAVAEFEAEHGAFTPAELSAADKELGRALRRS